MSYLHSLPLTSPWPQRLAFALSTAPRMLTHAWRQAVQRRAARRRAAAQQALVDSLDAHTLRDLGLGEWAGAREAERPLSWRDVDTFRF